MIIIIYICCDIIIITIIMISHMREIILVIGQRVVV